MKKDGKVYNRAKVKYGKRLLRWVVSGMNYAPSVGMEQAKQEAKELLCLPAACGRMAEEVERLLEVLDSNFVSQSVTMAAFEIVSRDDYERAEWLIEQASK
jgi:hypothetical protein